MLTDVKKVFLSFTFAVLISLVVLSRSQAQENTFGYSPRVEGVSDKTILDEITEISDAFALQNSGIITSMSLLKKVMDSDSSKIKKVLRSHGYYNSAVDIEIKELHDTVEAVFQINTGNRYVFDEIELHIKDQREELIKDLVQVLERCGIKKGKPCSTQVILEAKKMLLSHLTGVGYPFPQILDEQYIVDHTKDAMDIRYEIDPGPKAHFGRLILTGVTNTKPEYIERLLPWKKGELYSDRKLELFKKNLYETNLFSMINLNTAQKVNEDSSIDIILEVTEKKHKSITWGISYRSYEGPGITTGWENRNLFGGSEKLALNIGFLQDTHYQRLDFKKPFFLNNDQDLLLFLENRKEDYESYDSTSLTAKALINVHQWKGLTLSYGISDKQSHVEEIVRSYRYNLISTPIRLAKYEVDNLLNPKKGIKLSLDLYPSYLVDEGKEFLKAIWGGSTYLPLLREKDLILALRGNMGIIGGLTRDSVPMDERLFAGGDQSVRGYEYQSLGELSQDKPVGGNALFEFNSELRKGIKENMGLCLFLDGGSVYKSYPLDGSSALRYGAGIGLRFFTPLGPIRFDVATPLNRRPDKDRIFAIYFNVGQTF